MTTVYLPTTLPGLLVEGASSPSTSPIASGRPVAGVVHSALELALQHVGAVRRPLVPASAVEALSLTTSTTSVSWRVQKAAYPLCADVWLMLSSSASAPPTATLTLTSTTDATGVTESVEVPVGGGSTVVRLPITIGAGASVNPTFDYLALAGSVDAGSATVDSVLVVERPRSEVTT